MRGIENAVIPLGSLAKIWSAIRRIGVGIWTALHRREEAAFHSCRCYDVEE